jgi:outer membrane receptor protein involved in Fe transport
MVFALLFVATLSKMSFAQVTKGSISGNVVDPTGALVSDATLKATDTQTGVVFQATSGSSGAFHFNLVPPGTYRIALSKSGFSGKILDNVVVQTSQDAGLGSVVLSPGGAQDAVEVSATTTPLIETTQAQVTNTFSAQNIEKFTGVNENQGLDYMALLVPGVNATRDLGFSDTNGTGFESSGSRGRNNDQQIDGQNNNDNSVAGPAITLSDAEFISEYQIITNNFGPEYGRNGGSVVNLVTKSGTNHLHGSIYGNWTNSDLQTMNLYEKSFEGLSSQPRSNTEFGGFTVSFPIIKDRLFFFNGFDEQLWHEDDVVASGGVTPTQLGLTQAASCDFVNPNALTALTTYGPWGFATGNPTAISSSITNVTITNPNNAADTCQIQMAAVERDVPELQHLFNWLPRVDYSNGKDTIVTRYVLNRNNYFDIPDNGPAGYFYNEPSLAQAVKLGWTRAITNNIVNELSVGWSRENTQFGGSSNNSDVSTANLANGVASVAIGDGSNYLGYGTSYDLPQGRVVNTWQVQDNFTYQLRNHHLKAGVNWTYQRSLNNFLPNYNGTFTFTDYSSYLASQPASIDVTDGNTSLDFREHDTFAYAGDDWQVKPNLTLNLGITWSYYGQPANLFNKLDTAQQAGSNPLWNTALPTSVTTAPLLPSQYNLFGPSAGFAWTPSFLGSGVHKTVIRGGYRLAYDPPVYNIYLDMASNAPQVMSQALTPLSVNSAGVPEVNDVLPATPTGANVRAALAPYLQFGVQDPRQAEQITLPPQFKPDYVSSWSLGIQRQITNQIVAEARYVGNHGGNLFQVINANPYLAGLQANFPNQIPSNITVGANGRENGADYINIQRTNTGWSDYSALQTELRAENLFHQLMFTASYTWSKTTDNTSEIFSTMGAGNTSTLSQNPLNYTSAEHGISGLDIPQNFTLNAVEELPFYKEQNGLVGHLLGGWSLSATYYLASGQPFTPIQYEFEYVASGASNNPANGVADYAVNSTGDGGRDLDNLRPFLGSRSAPLTQVGAYAGDVCSYYEGASCGVAATQLISFNNANKTQDASVTTVSANQVRYIMNGPVSEGIEGTPFGNVGRNDARDARTDYLNATLTKNFKLRKGLNALLRANFANVLNHPNYGSVDPYLDDAGNFGPYNGFGNPATTPTTSGTGTREITFSGKISW